MTIGILVKKMRMTQIVVRGELIDVTPLGVEDNVVSQAGSSSCQIAAEICSENKLNSSQLGHLRKNQISPRKYLREIRGMTGFKVGSPLGSELFQEREKIKVTGTSKGKGTAGVIKRYGFSRGNMSHGGGPVHRHMGSASGGRGTNQGIPKGKKMPGRMGNQKTTQLSVIEKIDSANQIIYVRGSVPGTVRGLIVLRKGN